MDRKSRLLRGALAGAIGAMAASLIIHEFVAQGQTGRSDGESHPGSRQPDGQPPHASGVNASGKGERESSCVLTRFASRPAIRYGVSGLLGAIYGALAEESGNVTSGFGTSFGNLLFTSANLLSTPALRLALSSDDDAVKSLPPPFSGHVIYGVTTELVRRLTRSALEGIG